MSIRQAPKHWPQIEREAQGFNLALGLALCAIASERHRHHPDHWERQSHLLARAALAHRPCLLALGAEGVAQEFALYTLAKRFDRHAPSPQSSALGEFFLAIAPQEPSLDWVASWAGEKGGLESAGELWYASASALWQNSEFSHAPWPSRWGAIFCVESLFLVEPEADPWACSDASTLFSWTRARVERSKIAPLAPPAAQAAPGLRL